VKSLGETITGQGIRGKAKRFAKRQPKKKVSCEPARSAWKSMPLKMGGGVLSPGFWTTGRKQGGIQELKKKSLALGRRENAQHLSKKKKERWPGSPQQAKCYRRSEKKK